MPNKAVTCLVTVHGIGFQRAPSSDDPYGYADTLHERLSGYLTPALLSDDPNRTRSRPGQFGAIYVQSHFNGSVEQGLKRLGSWNADGTSVDHEHAPLVANDEPIAHVALVYAHPESQAFQHVGSALQAAAEGLLTHPRYGSIFGIAGTLVSDLRAPAEHPSTADCSEPPSLSARPRPARDPAALPPDHPWYQRLVRWPTSAAAAQPGDQGNVIRALEEDVTTYVFRNDLRDGVRDFLSEALQRLANRDDVANIVVNGHSQGTVAAYDAVHDLPADDARKILHFITSGCPLRKYVDLFYWGDEIRNVGLTGRWTNFFDKYDPVADGLGSKVWQPGWGLEDVPPGDGDTLFHYQPPDATEPVPFTRLFDVQVNNLVNSCGAVRAHNYWDNQVEWISAVGDSLRELTQ